jgi:hypothetical protein
VTLRHLVDLDLFWHKRSRKLVAMSEGEIVTGGPSCRLAKLIMRHPDFWEALDEPRASAAKCESKPKGQCFTGVVAHGDVLRSIALSIDRARTSASANSN